MVKSEEIWRIVYAEEYRRLRDDAPWPITDEQLAEIAAEAARRAAIAASVV